MVRVALFYGDKGKGGTSGDLVPATQTSNLLSRIYEGWQQLALFRNTCNSTGSASACSARQWFSLLKLQVLDPHNINLPSNEWPRIEKS